MRTMARAHRRATGMDTPYTTKPTLLDYEIQMLEEGIALADAFARLDPTGAASRRARSVMPALMLRLQRAMREREKRR